MKLALHRRGTGPRVAALVHGASASADIWRDFATVLIERYDLSVISVDLRGHGSSAHADRYLFKDFTQDLIETLPSGLDFLIGQSLGGRVCAEAIEALLPRRYVGIDPAFDISALAGYALGTIGPMQVHFPDWLLKLLGAPPKGAAPDSLGRYRQAWKTWDRKMMMQMARTEIAHPFTAGPPLVPSTVVMADPSFAVSKKLATELGAAGWDMRVKPGGVHELHVQDPAGLAVLLDDILRVPQ